ncbi:MAG: hypothetical protein H6755_01915 [Candidatus Omnitrophica bacterium]|nr:hypothetical protein [Candidatus Omnitrophota bacterium]MCB9747145.1 hypothetical protein [Candidatus Omnitrophota bacterium]
MFWIGRATSFILTISILASPSMVFAGGLVAVQQQAVQRQQQAYQQALIQQQQAAYQQAVQQQQSAVQQQYLQQQRQAQLQSYNQAVQQQVYEQMIKQRQAQQQQVYQQAYAQAVQQKTYQAAAQARAVGEQQVLQQQIYNKAIERKIQEERFQQAKVLTNQIYDETEEIVGLKKIWEELEITSEVWPQIIDREPKRLSIQRQIDLYKEQGINIYKSADHYIGMIDSLSINNPSLLKNPFEKVVMLVAVLEYDFDNGQDRDSLARQILGGKLYEENKRRLGR